MIKFLKQLAKNKKGSEVVEKIFMVVVSIAIAAVAVTWIVSLVNSAMAKNGEATNESTINGTDEVTNPYA